MEIFMSGSADARSAKLLSKPRHVGVRMSGPCSESFHVKLSRIYIRLQV